MRKGLLKKLDLDTQLELLKEKYEQTKASIESQGGTPVSGDQAAVRIQQGALTGHCQERQQAADDICANCSMVDARAVDARVGLKGPLMTQTGNQLPMLPWNLAAKLIKGRQIGTDLTCRSEFSGFAGLPQGSINLKSAHNIANLIVGDIVGRKLKSHPAGGFLV